jgi:hypothetical protein
MLAIAAGLGELSNGQKIEFLRQVRPSIDPAQSEQVLNFLDLYSELRRKRHRSPAELVLVEKFRRQLDIAWEKLRERTEGMLAASGADELTPAMESGLLEIDLLLDERDDFSPGDMLDEFLDRLATALTHTAVYPLFDDAAGSLVQAHVAEGLIVPTASSEARGRQVAAAADFMSRLPTFPAASIKEILDIRDELRAPLIRFRAGMVGLTRMLTAAAYEKPFSGEVEQVYVEQVAPALAEISEAVKDNKYLRELLGEAITDMKTIATAVLTLGITRTASLTPLIAGGAAAATAAMTAAWNTAAENKRIRRQHFYFLYETQRLLRSH